MGAAAFVPDHGHVPVFTLAGGCSGRILPVVEDRWVDTADLAIIVTGVVGLGTPGLSALFQWRRDQGTAARVRSDKDLDELRGLLDELTATMYTHTMSLIALEAWMRQSTFGLSHAKSSPRVQTTRATLYTLNARLVIRRGRDDQLLKALGVYLKTTDDAIAEMDALWPKGEPFDYTDEQLEARARRYWHVYEGFVDACKAEVGSRIIT
jgi:hypothetical protein